MKRGVPQGRTALSLAVTESLPSTLNAIVAHAAVGEQRLWASCAVLFGACAVFLPPPIGGTAASAPAWRSSHSKGSAARGGAAGRVAEGSSSMADVVQYATLRKRASKPKTRLASPRSNRNSRTGEEGFVPALAGLLVP